MNILFVYYIPSGGMETLNRMRNLALKQIGLNCSFLYHQEGTGLQNKVDAPLFITNQDLEIKRIIDEGNFSCIVVASDPQMLERIRNLGYKGKLIYEIQGLGNNRDFAYNYLKNYAYKYIQNYADSILSPETPHLIEATTNIFSGKPYFHFHNGIDTSLVNYRSLPKEAGPIIGWVGRIEENKNWRDFLLICTKLKRKFPSLKVWMFEDNTLSTQQERTKFNNLIVTLGLKEALTTYANQPYEKMPSFYSRIGDSGGFLCSTSKIEGFGYAVLEAIACKCPVLATDSDGVRSFIKHNRTGKFFEFGDLQAALTEGEELIENHELREFIKNEGYDYVRKTFSLSTYAAHFNSMLSQLKA